MEGIHLASAGGQQTGPYTDEQVRQMWMNGQLTPDTRFWAEGMPEWRPLREMPGVAGVAVAPLPQLGNNLPSSVYAHAAGDPHAFAFDPNPGVRFTTWMLWAYMLMTVLDMAGQVWEAAVGGVTGSGNANSTPAGTYRFVVSCVFSIVGIVTAVAFLRWLYRTAVNVRGFGAGGLESSPGWAVGWYFVPFVALWKPYQAMREIWQASHDPRDWRSAPVPAVVGVWWALWLFSGVLYWAALLLILVTLGGADAAVTALSLVANLLSLGLCWAAVRLVNGLHEVQQAWVGQGDDAAAVPGPASPAAAR